MVEEVAQRPSRNPVTRGWDPTVACEVSRQAQGAFLNHRGPAYFSTTAFIRSSVVRMPFSLVRPRSGPSNAQ